MQKSWRCCLAASASNVITESSSAEGQVAVEPEEHPQSVRDDVGQTAEGQATEGQTAEGLL